MLIKKEQGQKVYVNTVVLAASILLTGNNFYKFALLTQVICDVIARAWGKKFQCRIP